MAGKHGYKNGFIRPSTSRKLDFSNVAKRILSQETKDVIFQIKKVHHPFDPQLQSAFMEFSDYYQNVGAKDVDLNEVSLLLSGVGKIYSSQVDSLMKDVEDLASRCKRYKESWADKKKSNKEENAEENKGKIKNSQTEENQEKTPDAESESLNNDVNLVIEETASDTNNVENNQDTHDTVEVPQEVPEEPGQVVVEPEIQVDDDDVELICEIAAPLAGTTPEVQPEPTTENSTEQELLNTENNSDEPAKKKRKNGLVLPPDLVSCDEELEKLLAAGYFMNIDDDMLPPSLAKAVRCFKRKIYSEDNIPLTKKTKDDPPLSTNETEQDISSQETFDSGFCPSQEPEEPEDVKPDISMINIEPSEAGSIHIGSCPEFPAATAATFSSEDQKYIQDCIHELHYLQFTFGLTKTELDAAFSKTVERMSKIFKKNNIPICRSVTKTLTNTSAMASSPSKPPPNGIIHPALKNNLGDIYNELVAVCRKECESIITNTSLSILERSKDKSFAENRENIRTMIAELQRNIVPKFARVPLMAENTPEFFQHVANFEKKMKKILEEEAKKDEFDVRKYERNVLEVTAKESIELDRNEELNRAANSPLRSQSIDGDQNHLDHIFPSPSTRSSFDGSQCSFGGSWVPLKHIFHHMKSIDRTETARSFYAVLALLSYQNLDINYDQLYSAESADLIRKQLTEGGRDEEMDLKFPRGVKIVTSRCPDADKEEVFIAALTSESRDESFRHLLAQETRNIAERNGVQCSSQNIEDIDEGIAENMADFVEESSPAYSGRLQARRRPRKPTLPNP